MIIKELPQGTMKAPCRSQTRAKQDHNPPSSRQKKCCTTRTQKSQSPQGNTFLFIPISLLIPPLWPGDKEMIKSAGTQEELWMNALVAPEDTEIFHKVNKRSIYRGEPWWCNEQGRRGRAWWITKKRMVKTSLARQNLVGSLRSADKMPTKSFLLGFQLNFHVEIQLKIA